MALVRRRLAFRAAVIACLSLGVLARGVAATPTEQGQMLVFNGDAFVTAHSLVQQPYEAFTWEAWIHTCDECADSTLFAYAVAPFDRVALVISSARNVKLCRDVSSDLSECALLYSKFNSYSNRKERDFADNAWHHIAATWSPSDNGTARVYKNGLLVSAVPTGVVAPLPPGGAFFIGGLPSRTGMTAMLHGAMDSIRLWSSARTQQQLLDGMYLSGSELACEAGLTGAWDLDEALSAPIALDAGPLKNDLRLVSPPTFQVLTDTPDGGLVPSEDEGKSSALVFAATRALARNVTGIPSGSFTVEMFVQTPPAAEDTSHPAPVTALFSYASAGGDGKTQGFLDNAILLQLLNSGFYFDETAVPPTVRPLRGNLDVWVNAASRAGTAHEDATGVATGRVVFDTPALADGRWHHVAVAWTKEGGAVRAWIDGEPARTLAGSTDTVASDTLRMSSGSVALGADQDCPGGCLSPAQSLRGALAEVRVWDRPLITEQVKAVMQWPWRVPQPPSSEQLGGASLAARWSFGAGQRSPSCASGDGECIVAASAPSLALSITGEAPVRTLSSAPHQPPVDERAAKRPVMAAGGAVSFSGQLALVCSNLSFGQGAPGATSATVEFWMRSTDKCNDGTPFSYATGKYGIGDNTLTVVGYNDWQIAVNEDQGSRRLTPTQHMDDKAGLSSTTGDWTHIAVTWSSASGTTKLYVDGGLAWTTRRAAGSLLSAHGTLVVGREQDCVGGCFDLDQDFRGELDEMRLWAAERTPDEIRAYMDVYGAPKELMRHRDLIALWAFDEGAGHIAHDSSPNGNHLVFTRPELASWTPSTVAERKHEREEQRTPPSPSSPGSGRRHHRRGHPLRTFILITLLAGFGCCCVVAFIRRHELAPAAAEAAIRLRERLSGRHSSYVPVDEDASLFPDDFSHYVPPMGR